MPDDLRENLSGVWGEELLSLESENTSDFERQNTIEKAINSAPAIEENDVTHEKMMKFEPLLEAEGKCNLWSNNLIHGECPCHCLGQTVWYPEHANLCLILEWKKFGQSGYPTISRKSRF